jgi:hypothetical protein
MTAELQAGAFLSDDSPPQQVNCSPAGIIVIRFPRPNVALVSVTTQNKLTLLVCRRTRAVDRSAAILIVAINVLI